MKTESHPRPGRPFGGDLRPELAQRAAAGDTPAFEAIMRRHNQLLFRTARSILKSDVETEGRAPGGLSARLAGDRRLSRRGEAFHLAGAHRHQPGLRRLRRRSAQIIPLDTAMEPIDPEMRLALEDDPDHGPGAQGDARRGAPA
jgi:RNA polymerase sigma-70 factor (ECF subfamily)